MVFEYHEVKQGRFEVSGIMDQPAFNQWLSQYGKAWESLDPAAAAELYAEDATYQETPFVAPLRGREALLRYWTHVCETQRDVRFGFEILGFSDDRGFASWWATFRRIPPDVYVELNGVFVLTFDEGGRCKSLREWWHRRDLSSA